MHWVANGEGNGGRMGRFFSFMALYLDCIGFWLIFAMPLVIDGGEFLTINFELS